MNRSGEQLARLATIARLLAFPWGNRSSCFVCVPTQGSRREPDSQSRSHALRLPKWRGDGRELIFQSLDGPLMSVDIMLDGGQTLPGACKPWPHSAVRRLMDVATTASRFLVAMPTVEGGRTPITVMRNWTAEVPHPDARRRTRRAHESPGSPRAPLKSSCHLRYERASTFAWRYGGQAAARTASYPSCRSPSTSLPLEAANTPSRVIIDISASRLN